MTTEPGGLPPFDPAHPAVNSVPAWLSTAVQDTPQGQMALMTVRIPNTTLTIVLGKADLENWIRQMQSTADQMSGIILAQPGMVIPQFPPNGHPG